MPSPRVKFVVMGCLIAAHALAQPQKTASIEGAVVNSVTGEPIARAHVTLNAYPVRETYGAMTGTDGKFSVAPIPAGSYIVAAERLGFVSSRQPEPITLSPGDAKTEIRVKLIPKGAIAGRVVDSEGEPVERVNISAIVNHDDAGTAITDEKGEFRIGGLAPGKYRVRARPQLDEYPQEIRTDGTEEIHYLRTYYPNAPDQISAARVEVTAGSETAGIEIHLRRGPIVNVSGAIIGIPKGAHEVWLMVQEGCNDSESYESTVNPNGKFHLWRVEPGRYCLRASQYGGENDPLRSPPVEVNVVNESVENVALRMIPASDIQGRIEYDDEQEKAPTSPPGKNQISLQSLTLEKKSRPVEIGADGSFKLEGVQPDIYRVNVSRDGVYVKSTVLGQLRADGAMLDARNGAAGQMLSVQVSSGVADLSGTVHRGNDVAAGARVVLSADESLAYGFSRDVTADAAGAFVIGGIPPGKYKLLVVEPGGSISEAGESIEFAPQDKVTRDLQLR